MNTNNNEQYNELAVPYLAENTQTEIRQEQPNDYHITVSGIDIPWVGVVSFIVVSWVSIFMILSKSYTDAQKKDALTINLFHTLPCRSCHYFCNNQHLKCAVQPSIVMTEQATNCPDYCTKKLKLFK